MDIYENRRRWLAYWIEHDYGGDRKKVELATGYTRSQISQFLSSTYQDGKSPQERAARRIEERFGKAERIMETPAPVPGREPLVPVLKYSGPGPTTPIISGSAAQNVRISRTQNYDMLVSNVVEAAYRQGERSSVPYYVPLVAPPHREQEVPGYVQEALDAVILAHKANAPREVFDAVRILLSQHLKSPEGGTITAQQKDETVKKPAASMQSIAEDADRAIRDAESRLATRTEETRAARKTGVRRSKGVRH